MSTTSKDKENWDKANSKEITNRKNGDIEDNVRDEMILSKALNEWEERGYIIRKAIPVSVAYLLQTSIQLISVLSLGHLGSVELAASTLATMLMGSYLQGAKAAGFKSFQVTFSAVIYGSATALDTLCSQAYTSGNLKMVGVYLQRAIIINLLGFIPIAFIWWEAELILTLIGQSPEISAKTALFLKYLLIGAPAFLLFENLKRYLQAQGIMKASTYVLIICCIIDICINFTLVWYKPLSLGFIGAPISTSITYWLMFFLLAIYTKFINGYQAWGGWSRAAFHGWKHILSYMIPGILMVCSEWWAFELISLLSGYLGQLSLASQGIIITSINFLYQLSFGVSTAASNRIGNLLGAGLVERAKMASKLSMQFAIIVALFNATILIVFKDYWGLIKCTSYVLPLAGIFEISDGLNSIGYGILRGQGRQNIGAFLNTPGYFILGLPIGIFTAFKLGYGLNEECKKRMKEGKEKFDSMISDDPYCDDDI
ncbi:13970_t:CDS:2 [Dentiscutata erythropus]|uniref:13970_t:CDS:1 n=1 Tax=Dentiscutata erythropus TaxID=1348616 RepID=A0A9N9BFY5_9GLOM|nr:13970_t:CDS:2 [Dentiscutata erythropus]